MTKNASKPAPAPESPPATDSAVTPPAPEAPAQPPTDAGSQAVSMVKARVLVAGVFGNVDDLVEVAQADASSGDLDTHPEAVAYLERELKKEVRRLAFREGYPEDPAA